MEKRRLGRTGHMSTVVTFGAAGIGRVEQDVADRAVQVSLDHGVNHFDVAPGYGDAELRLRPWMPRIRDQVFLGCKTTQRTKEGAKAELHRSLERLGHSGIPVARTAHTTTSRVTHLVWRTPGRLGAISRSG